MTTSVPHRSWTGDEPVTCILFDLDGTLIDTTDLIFRSYQHALTSVTAQPATTAELYLGYGQPLHQSFTSILAHRRVRMSEPAHANLIDELIRTYRAFNVVHHDDLARAFPGVRSTLAELTRRGYTLGLVTSKTRQIAERGLRLLELSDAFRTTVFMEDSERHKPHPDPLWVALERVGLRSRPAGAVYVGDSTHDLRAGRAAGLRTVAALWGPFPVESLLALEPDRTVATVIDLLDYFPGI